MEERNKANDENRVEMNITMLKKKEQMNNEIRRRFISARHESVVDGLKMLKSRKAFN